MVSHRNIKKPSQLAAAQAESKLVVFAGAGVSMGDPSNLPGYPQLAKQLYERVNREYPDKDTNTDELIATLELDCPVIRNYAHEIYSNPDSKPTHLHYDLLRLFSSVEEMKVVTTNYDMHFLTASKEVFDEKPEISHAPKLPLGDDITGIIHVHGSVEQHSDRLILSSKDFAEAYLGKGWAVRFLKDVLKEYVVLLVGYSVRDILVRYLFQACAEEIKHFALVPEKTGARWELLGITAIEYPVVDEADKHAALVDVVKQWADVHRSSISYRELEKKMQRVVCQTERHFEAGHDTPPQDAVDFLTDMLEQEVGLRYFRRYARSPAWLEWLDERQFLPSLFVFNKELNERERLLAGWFADNFVSSRAEQGLLFLLKKQQMLNPSLWDAIVWNLAYGDPLLEPEVFAKWVTAALNCAPSEPYRLKQLSYILARDLDVEYRPSIMLLFEYLTRPKLVLENQFSFDPGNPPSETGAAITMIGETYDIKETWRHRLRPLLPQLAVRLASMFTSHFQQANSMLRAVGSAGENWDPISWGRSAIEDHEQDSDGYGFEIIIDYARDVIEYLLSNNGELADSLIAEWSFSDAPILKRLSIYAVQKCPRRTPDEKLVWLLERHWFYVSGLKHEIFQLLKSVFPHASQSAQSRVIERAKQGPTQKDTDQPDHDYYEIYNLLYWLARIAPECAPAKEAFDNMQKERPDFGPRGEHADLDTWSSGLVYAGGHSPVETGDLLSKEPTHWVGLILAFEGDRAEGPYREGLMNKVGEAAVQRPSWGLDMAKELRRLGEWKRDIWITLLHSWVKAQFDSKQWEQLLGILAAPEVGSSFSLQVSSLLSKSAEKKADGIPIDLLDKAETVGDALWEQSNQAAEATEASDDWLFEAINHTAGQLTLFWLHSVSRRLEKGSGDEHTDAPILQVAVHNDHRWFNARLPIGKSRLGKPSELPLRHRSGFHTNKDSASSELARGCRPRRPMLARVHRLGSAQSADTSRFGTFVQAGCG